MTIIIKKFSPTSHKVKAVIYGSSGVGKTYFGSTAKNSIFASAEGGLLSIASKNPNYVEIKSLQDLKDFYQYLKTQKHDFETLIIDSITEINEIIKIDIEKRTGRDMIIKDWGTLAKEIKSLLRNFRDLPMNVIFIAQETGGDEKDEGGAPVKMVPSLNGKASTEIAYFMDIVGYLYIDKLGQRKIITNQNAKYLSKDRSGLLGNDTPADFSVWIDKISKMDIVENEEVVDTFISKEKSDVKTSTKFNLVKQRLETLKTEEEMIKALGSIENIGGITTDEKNELTTYIQEKIDSIEFEKVEESKKEKEKEVVEDKKEEVKKVVKKVKVEAK